MGIHEAFENPLETKLLLGVIAQEISVCISGFGKAHDLEIICGLKIITLTITITIIITQY